MGLDAIEAEAALCFDGQKAPYSCPVHCPATHLGLGLISQGAPRGLGGGGLLLTAGISTLDAREGLRLERLVSGGHIQAGRCHWGKGQGGGWTTGQWMKVGGGAGSQGGTCWSPSVAKGLHQNPNFGHEIPGKTQLSRIRTYL